MYPIIQVVGLQAQDHNNQNCLYLGVLLTQPASARQSSSPWLLHRLPQRANRVVIALVLKADPIDLQDHISRLYPAIEGHGASGRQHAHSTSYQHVVALIPVSAKLSICSALQNVPQHYWLLGTCYVPGNLQLSKILHYVISHIKQEPRACSFILSLHDINKYFFENKTLITC